MHLARLSRLCFIAFMAPADGTVVTIAGQSSGGHVDATGTNARFNIAPHSAGSALGITPDGTKLILIQSFTFTIRQIDVSTVAVTTLAGNGTQAHVDGTGTNAQLSGLLSNKGGNVALSNTEMYFPDGNRVRKIVLSSGVVTTLAGQASSGNADGTGAAASFAEPSSVVFSSDSTQLFVTVSTGIRKIEISSGAVTTFAGGATTGSTDGIGTNAKFEGPVGMVISSDGAKLFVADQVRIRQVMVSTGTVTTVAGDSAGGNPPGNTADDDVGTLAKFRSFGGKGILGLALSSDDLVLYAAENWGHRVRRVIVGGSDFGRVTTVVGQYSGGNVVPGLGDGTLSMTADSQYLNTAAQMKGPEGIALSPDDTSLYISHAPGIIRKATLGPRPPPPGPPPLPPPRPPPPLLPPPPSPSVPPPLLANSTNMTTNTSSTMIPGVELPPEKPQPTLEQQAVIAAAAPVVTTTSAVAITTAIGVAGPAAAVPLAFALQKFCMFGDLASAPTDPVATGIGENIQWVQGRFNLLGSAQDDDGDEGRRLSPSKGKSSSPVQRKSQLQKKLTLNLYSSIADMGIFLGSFVVLHAGVLWLWKLRCNRKFYRKQRQVMPSTTSARATPLEITRTSIISDQTPVSPPPSPSDELRCSAEDKCNTSTHTAQQQLAMSQQPKKPSRQTSSLSKAELKRRARQRSLGNKAPEKPTLPPGYVSLPQTLLFPNLETALFSFFISGIVQASASIIGAWSSGIVDELGALALAVSALLLVTFVLVYEFLRLRSFSKDCQEATFYASPPVASYKEVDDPLLSFLARCRLIKPRSRFSGFYETPVDQMHEPQRTEAYVRPALLYQELVHHCLFGR